MEAVTAFVEAFWHWLSTTPYTRALEREVERLRAENRGLIDSLLGTKGVGPVLGPVEQSKTADAQGRGQGTGNRGQGPAASSRRAGRRSWAQINRELELKSAREYREWARKTAGGPETAGEPASARGTGDAGH